MAAPVSWVGSTVTGPSDVSTSGVLVGGMNFGSSTPVVINGVSFAGDPSPTTVASLGLGTATVLPGFANGANFNAWTGADPGGSAAYGTALDSARWSDSVTSGTVVLGQLTVGRRYLVQLWIADTRTGTDGRVRTVDGFSTSSSGPNIATGTFTADATTQTITIAGVSGSHGPQVNLLLLRDITPIVVTNTNDAGPGSLRQAIAAAAVAPGSPEIVFAPALSGGTITLASTLTVGGTGGLSINAFALPGGLTINDGTATSFGLMSIASGKDVTIRGITFANGGGNVFATTDDGGGFGFSGAGGAINSAGNLTVSACTFTGNTAERGGAIFNSGRLTVSHCTFVGNTALTDGGAIATDSFVGGETLRLINSTLSENTAARGGALHSGDCRITHCTVTNNTATTGGGMFTWNDNLILENSIFANSLASVPGAKGVEIDVSSNTVVTLVGANIVRNLMTQNGVSGIVTIEGTGTIARVDPQLGGLRYNGGRTQTRAPLASSPAIDAAQAIAGLETDQRGFFRNRDGNGVAGALPDIGAHEVQSTRVDSFLSTPIIVTTAADEMDPPEVLGSGVSLREALAGMHRVTHISFDPSTLNGATISLGNPHGGESAILFSGLLVEIDARDLDAGLTINLGGASGYRFFQVPNGCQLNLRRLTLEGGGGGGLSAGGALNVESEAFLNLEGCTLTGNSAANGGAIQNFGNTDMTRCTIAGNSAGFGAIRNGGVLLITHCTISGNFASALGGGILNSGGLRLTSSILAGNSAPSAADLWNGGIFESTGAANLIQSFVNDGGSVGGSDIIISAAPMLAPLGSYGGPTRTMVPLPGSPAIDRFNIFINYTDQRGIIGPLDGNGDGILAGDLGAVEFAFVRVTTSLDENDSPAGAAISLREALRDAAAGITPADTIGFAPALKGATLRLGPSGTDPTALAIASRAVVDGGGLGIVLTPQTPASGHRLFEVLDGAHLTLRGLTLANAGGGGLASGGALQVNSGGVAVLENCALTGNSATSGGAIGNSGSLSLARCTLSGNSATNGSAINNFGEALLRQCTLSGNSTQFGTIRSAATLGVEHCTISGNFGSSIGAGILNSGALTLTNSIVAGNSGVSPTDIWNGAAITRSGANIVPSFTSDGGSQSGPNALVVAPLLAPLGDYGGPTATMALKPASPARNTAVGSSFTTDQRGLPMVGIPDIGAYEAGNAAGYQAFIWEALPAGSTPAEHAGTFDYDHDGVPNLVEYGFGLNPTVADSASLPRVQRGGGWMSLSFTPPAGVSGIYYFGETSTTLKAGSWTPLPNTGTTGTYRYATPDSDLRRFMRIGVREGLPPGPP